MTSIATKIFAVAALALAGSVSFASTDAEARGFRGGGFHAGGFHGGAFRHGGFRHGYRPNIRPLWARPGGWHGHRPYGWHRRHVHFGVIGVGAAVLPACTVIRRFDPAYGIYRRVTVCD